MEPQRAAAAIAAMKATPPESEQDRDVKRKREQRNKAAEIYIPPIVDLKRREKCLDDPERFLLTYGRPDEDRAAELQDGRFWMPFASHHLKMIEAIHSRAISGGDKAVAAPRGDGKSTVVFWMLLFILLAELRRHPCGIGQTNAKAKEKIFTPIVEQLTWNEYLAEDFPEVCYPLKELNGAPQRANKQHVAGVNTRIECTQNHLRLPIVKGYPSNYGGATLDYYGFDGDIRGSRHDFAAIDDPEKREVAFSRPTGGRPAQHEVIERTIDADVAGLAFPNSTIPRVVITTIQNRQCYSYRVTSRDVKEGGKPSFEGDRYGILAKWPTNRKLWDEYVSIRQQGQAEGDKDGEKAFDFYIANRDKMDEGVEVSNPHRVDKNNRFEVSAVQAFFNRVADWGLSRVMSELQNNPEEEETAESLGISPGLVAKRVNGLKPNTLPKAEGVKVTLGIDIGNRESNWVKVAWHGNAVGTVIDEGVLKTADMVTNPDQAYLTDQLIEAFEKWHVSIMQENPPDFCLMDSGSGTHRDAVYEFVRRVGSPFAAAKGWDVGRFRMPQIGKNGQPPEGKLPFYECWGHHQRGEDIWLYNVNTEFWKNWVQQGFMIPTFDDNQQFNDGSISLHSTPPKQRDRWKDFSESMCSEGIEELFVPGKGYVKSWKVHSKNNHKLDAMALACAAAGCLGVKRVRRIETARAKPIERKPNRMRTPDGRNYLVTER